MNSKISLKKKLIAALKVTIVVIILFFFVQNIYKNWSEVKGFQWQFNYILLISSMIILIAYLFFSAFLWGEILKKLGERLKLLDTLRIWNYCQLGRYIPGKVWIILGRVHLCEKCGISKKKTAISAILEIFFIILTGFVFSFVSLISKKGDFNRYMLFFLIPAIALIAYPKGLERIINYVIKRRTNENMGIKFGYTTILKLLIVYLINWFLLGVAFVLFISSFVSFPPSQYIYVMGILALAWLVGFLSFLTPAGLGVREGVMVLFFAETFSPSMAILISILSRIWISVGELLSVAISSGISHYSNPESKKLESKMEKQDG